MDSGKDNFNFLIESEKSLSEPLQIKLKKIKSMIKEGKSIYADKFPKNADIKEIKSNYSHLDAGDRADETYRIAGRAVVFRVHGKATFCDLKDSTGTIQLYINVKTIGEDKYNEFLDLDIGDWLGIEGNVFVTHKGELSINVRDFKLLSKSIRIMPEKWHGLRDVELRYRQRYLDFLVNPEIKDVFMVRFKVIDAIREFLNSRGFLEVETPMLQIIPGGAAAKPFITHHNALNMDLYLRIAPELYLKRLIIGGFEKVYEINRNFRNEGISHKHNPEFTMVEFYQAFVDYNTLMDLTEELLKFVALKSINKLDISYKENKISFDFKWERITMIDSIKKYGGIEISTDMQLKDLKKVAHSNNIIIEKDFNKGKIINEIFEKVVEPRLIQPTFIKDYPIEISPLARKHPDNPELTERFELFIGGEEIANAFSELIDPRDQFERFKEQSKSKIEEERLTGKIDLDFVKALEYGMPPTGGEGIGIDRLVMILADCNSIRDVILFPLLRPEKE